MMRCLMTAAMVGCVVCVCPRGLRAQPQPGGVAEATLEELRDRGRACYRRRDYPCALQFFERAYRIDPQPKTLFNLASAQDKLGLAVRAYRNYRRYLRGAPAAPAEALLHIQRRLQLLVPKVARLVVVVRPSQARFRLIGDDAIGQGPSDELVVSPGVYQLIVEAPAHQTQRQTIRLIAGSVARRELSLSPIVSASLPVAVARSQPELAPAAAQTEPARLFFPAAGESPLDPPLHSVLPIESALLTSRVLSYLDLTHDGASGKTSYTLGLSGRLALWRRIAFEVHVPFLVHGWLVRQRSPTLPSNMATPLDGSAWAVGCASGATSLAKGSRSSVILVRYCRASRATRCLACTRCSAAVWRSLSSLAL